MEGVGNQRKAVWRCRCFCGKERKATTSLLRAGQARSCGCVRIYKTHAVTLSTPLVCKEVSESGLQTCTRCEKPLPLQEFHKQKGAPTGHRTTCRKCRGVVRSANKAERSAKDKARYQANKEERRIKTRCYKFCLTPEQYKSLLKQQDECCAVCRCTTPGGVGGWHVDHDHACCPGKKSCGHCVRGILCSPCNMALGNVKDSPEILLSLVNYLAKYKNKRTAA